jgi:hypothetical protein
MITLVVQKCWFNIYSEMVMLEVALHVTGIKPIVFNLEIPEDVLALLKNTHLFQHGLTSSTEFAGDWTGQTWKITTT